MAHIFIRMYYVYLHPTHDPNQSFTLPLPPPKHNDNDDSSELHVFYAWILRTMRIINISDLRVCVSVLRARSFWLGHNNRKHQVFLRVLFFRQRRGT